MYVTVSTVSTVSIVYFSQSKVLLMRLSVEIEDEEFRRHTVDTVDTVGKDHRKLLHSVG